MIPNNDSEGYMTAVLPIENQETWESDTSWQSAPSSSSLGSDQYLGYSPNTLRPIVEVRRSDPRVTLPNCAIQTNTVPQNSEHVANQQPSDLTVQLWDALKSPELAEMMQSCVTTGLQNFLTHHLVPLQNKVDENERTTNEKNPRNTKSHGKKRTKNTPTKKMCQHFKTYPNTSEPPEVLPKKNKL